jgi:hypothetical protein
LPRCRVELSRPTVAITSATSVATSSARAGTSPVSAASAAQNSSP